MIAMDTAEIVERDAHLAERWGRTGGLRAL
jgi:hypothetical protein